jgi:aminoglycoside/choline kinase family phosphotransferase
VPKTIHALIAHPTEPRVLLTPSLGGALALPAFSIDVPRGQDPDRTIASAVRAGLGLNTRLLRWRVDAESDGLCLLESTDPAWRPPPPARWAGSIDLQKLRLTLPDHASRLQRWLTEEESGDIPIERPPWQRRGWLPEISRWITAQLDLLSTTAAGPIEQIRAWSLSCVLRVPTAAGDLYVKSVPPFFSAEGTITAALAARFPMHVPTPLAINPATGWILLPSIEGEYLYRRGIERWEDAVRLLAAMQRAVAPDTVALLRAGIADRRLTVLKAGIPQLLNDEHATAPLTPDEQAELRALIPSLLAMCDALAAYPIPETLLHGDFHQANVFDTGDHLTIFDWTDACLGHPFLDLPVFIETIREEHRSDYEPRLWNAYLDCWPEIPRSERDTVRRLAITVGAVHHAISYHQLDRTLEPDARCELLDGTARWLRRILTATRSDPG